ncbi:MAG: DUF222 domain-containing protein [Actinomycetota bacterium]|nr:DUF222 domain-containing protein [Actinomycetota bacterium]
MSSFGLPSVAEIQNMAPGDIEALARELDRQRRVSEARIAVLVHRVGEAGAHLVDRHRTPKAWGQAACNWSGGEALRFVHTGAMLARFSSAAELASHGGLGVAQMHVLGRLVANPRVGEHLAAGEQTLVEAAVSCEFNDFVSVVTTWEHTADADGAHRGHERAHHNRNATATIVGEQSFLDAHGGVAAGVQIQAILDAYAQTEWHADWEAGVAVHGDSMCPGLLARTDGQRRFDALLAIFLKAASIDSDSTGSGCTVNLVVGYDTFQHHLQKALGGDPAPLDPNDPLHRCETGDGVPVDPYDMLVAAATGHVRRVVLDSAGVVVDLGRRQRLFTGPLRDAVLLQHRWCTWTGCSRPASQCEADHLLPWGTAGPSATTNGGPMCGYHNRWKATNYRTWRDPNGHWHHYRPDGTEIGWRAAQPPAHTTASATSPPTHADSASAS